MNIEFKMDKESLAGAALALRDALLSFREHVAGYYEEGLIDTQLAHLYPILNLCIAKNLEEPFDLIAYVNPRIFGDELAFPELTKPYYQLAELLRGGILTQDFWETDYCKHRLLPKQLRSPPEYIPSEKLQEQIKEDLKYKPGG